MNGKIKSAKDDFILTISDSEDDIPNFEKEEEEEEEQERKRIKTVKSKKKSKGKNKSANEEEEGNKEEDLNPDFQFSLEGYEKASKFDGWDFNVGSKTPTTASVDLDSIIRRKGGLGDLIIDHKDHDSGKENESENEEEQEDGDDEEEEEIEEGDEEVGSGEEKEEEEEEDEDEEEEDDEDEDDDELALDGFGMGIKAQPKVSNIDEEKEVGSEEVEEEDKDDDEEEEEEDDKEQEGDTAEDIAKYFASEEETTGTNSSIHKTFNTFSLSRPILRGLGALGYTTPTPIQSAVIPIALLGKDIVAGAVTGSGKTAAYMIPILERLLYKPAKVASSRVVIMTPTRELAIQVADVGRKLSRFVSNASFGLAVGGLNLRQQEQELKTRPDVVVATPGRFIDHIRNSPSFTIDDLEILVIDEADRMLEDGFEKEVSEILSLIPSKRQTLLFSATMNSSIKDLIKLSLQRPVRVMIDPPKQAAAQLIQEFVRIRKRDNLKPALLFNLLRIMDSSQQQRTIVFVARKETAHRIRVILGLLGIKIGELHGSLTQEQRLASVTNFKSLKVPVLLCTDLASRGLDIPKIELVINYDMPKTHEIYLHRVGRTARAGRGGRSISFVGESSSDRAIVKAAISSIQDAEGKGKALGRNVDWNEVEKINDMIEKKEGIIDEVLEEEKQEKEIIQAEMEIKKGENQLRYKNEIQSRPKRTWFETEKEKKQSATMKAIKKKPNRKKRKAEEERKDIQRSYKKTKIDRINQQFKKKGGKSNKSGKKNAVKMMRKTEKK